VVHRLPDVSAAQSATGEANSNLSTKTLPHGEAVELTRPAARPGMFAQLSPLRPVSCVILIEAGKEVRLR